jgi:hypothetical protein
MIGVNSATNSALGQSGGGGVALNRDALVLQQHRPDALSSPPFLRWLRSSNVFSVGLRKQFGQAVFILHNQRLCGTIKAAAVRLSLGF